MSIYNNEDKLVCMECEGKFTGKMVTYRKTLGIPAALCPNCRSDKIKERRK